MKVARRATPSLFVQDAERLRQLSLGVGQHREGQVPKIVVVPAPREVGRNVESERGQRVSDS
jgi:hypothetical protein